jgi:Abi-like protein
MQDSNHIFFDELSIIFSEERLDGYLNHAKCNNSKTDALVAYSWNIELSQALYPALQILEITLRNSLHQTLSTNFNTAHWFDLTFLHKREKKQIEQAKDDLKKEHKRIEAGHIVAKLSFGFWTSLFDVRYEHGQILWPKLLKPTFPYLSKSQRTRTYLSRELNRIRFLRNRIFHHEPIWHWKDLTDQHASIINMTKGLSPAASKYLDIFDQFLSIYFAGKVQIEAKLSQKR